MIRCSGDLHEEPITREVCLSCALKHGNRPPCGYSYPLLKAIFKSQSEDRSAEVHVSDLLGCLRKAYWEKTEPEPRYVHEMMILWLGIAVHASIEEAMDEPGWRKEERVEKDGVIGRVDSITPEEDILDFKTTRWLKPSNVPNDHHRKQVLIYKYMAGLNGGTMIQYIDMSGPSKCKSCKITVQMIEGEIVCPNCGHTSPEYHLGALVKNVRPKDIEESMALRANILDDALSSKTIPDAEPEWLCRYCPFLYKCPEGAK